MSKKILHATGLQTLLKIIENQYNNIPLGYHYHQDQDNTPLLKLLTPNMLRVGRINSRSLDGPIRLPASRQEQLKAVEEVYEAWFKVWKESYLPKLFFKPKWFKTDSDLKVGDLVWFIKEESKLSNDYTMGMVEQVNTGKDGLIRRVVVKYYNDKENHPRFTDRSARSLVKIFSADEACLTEDLAELQKFLDEEKSREAVADHIPSASVVDITVVGKTGDSRPQALTGELCKQLQLDPTPHQEENILGAFHMACNFSNSSKFVLADSEADYEGYRACDDNDQELELMYMDKLTQVIMSMDMKLQ